MRYNQSSITLPNTSSNNHFITCKETESHSIKITSLYIDGNRSNQNTDNDGIHIVNSQTEIEYEQLIDFGISRVLSKNESLQAKYGTFANLPPEIIKNEEYTIYFNWVISL